MATGTQDHVGIDLTPQEAEAVLELWAKRQAEGELRSRLNVQDLAEAMSLPPSEVEKMVAAIRQKSLVPPIAIPTAKPKPVNSFLIAVAVIVWVAILIGVGFGAYNSGRSSVRRQVYEFPAPMGINPPAVVVDGALAPMAVENATSVSSPAKYIPSGVTVEFKGYKVRGESKGDLTENRIQDTLKQVVDDVIPASQIQSGVSYGDVAVIDALQENNSAKIGGHIRFEKLTISAHGQTTSSIIPIALISEPRLSQLVQDEQMSRLKILANWAFNTQNSSTPAPAR